MPHKTHSLTIHSDGMGAAVHVPDITSQNLSVTSQFDIGVPSHKKIPTHLSLLNQQYAKQIESFAIQDILNAIGVVGLCVTSAVNPGVKLNLAKYDTCGEITAGSVHRTLQYKQGFIFPQRLTVDHRGDARLQVGLVPIWDKSNNIVIEADNAALPTITIASKRWTIGKATVSALALADYTRFEIDFGFRVESRAQESNLYDTHIEIKRTEPSITITGVDTEWFKAANIPVGGKAATHANTILFLRKRSAAGVGFVADGTAEHLKFTMYGVTNIGTLSTNEDRYAEQSIIITGSDDGTNHPIVYTGGVAIS